jgi:hypothetical protein
MIKEEMHPAGQRVPRLEPLHVDGERARTGGRRSQIPTTPAK